MFILAFSGHSSFDTSKLLVLNTISGKAVTSLSFKYFSTHVSKKSFFIISTHDIDGNSFNWSITS
ncbi:MAG: hypothetical protein Q8S84_04175 [bacterium]|nr:hypothetical protein [bacterium]MDP3380701.1 hypothetical protein [bacterium]